MEHLFLCGIKNRENSAFWQELIARHPEWRFGGYRTVSRMDESGIRHVHLLPAGGASPCCTAENEVGTCDHGSNARGIAERFDRIGTALLDSMGYDFMLMDEIGFMEKDAESFQQSILRCMDEKLPVIGCIKPADVLTTPLIQAIYARSDVKIITLPLPENDRQEQMKHIDEWLCEQIAQSKE